MINDLFEIIFTINSHGDWCNNAKIRYAYKKLGSLVHKDTWFFYTVKNKLLNDKKSLRYSDDKVKEMLETDKNFDYAVICKNVANMLKFIFDNTGIKCTIKKTNDAELYDSGNEIIEVFHYFVVAEGDEGKEYFLTLNPDLANIQIGRKTSHFANKVPYMIDRTFTNEDGKTETRLVQYYEGEELHCDSMTDEQIFELDKIIDSELHDFNYLYGDENPYYTDYFFKLLEDAYNNNENYFMDLSYDTQFYVDICNLANGMSLDEISEELKPIDPFNNDAVIEDSIYNIPVDRWETIKQYALVAVLQFFKEKFNVDIDIDKYYALMEEKQYAEMTSSFKRFFIEKVGADKLNNDFRILNPLRKIEKLRDLFINIDIVAYNREEIKDYKKVSDYIFKYFKHVALIFVEDNLLPTKKDSLSSEYIAYKLYRSLGKILDVGHITDFNKMGLAEQITVMKELIKIVLKDVGANQDSVPLFRPSKSNIENRIFSTVLIDKNDPDHAYYFIMVKKLLNDNSSNNGWKSMIYDFKNNTIKFQLPSDILNKYHVIKDDDLKLLIEEMNKPYQK